jgi:hypothetical protein
MQRVTSASVRVGGEIVGEIEKGLVCLVGLAREDTEDDAEYCSRRLLVRPRFIVACNIRLMVKLITPVAVRFPITLIERSIVARCCDGCTMEELCQLQWIQSVACESVHTTRVLCW